MASEARQETPTAKTPRSTGRTLSQEAGLQKPPKEDAIISGAPKAFLKSQREGISPNPIKDYRLTLSKALYSLGLSPTTEQIKRPWKVGIIGDGSAVYTVSNVPRLVKALQRTVVLNRKATPAKRCRLVFPGGKGVPPGFTTSSR